MDDSQTIEDYSILFKPVYNCESEGCHMLVWLPKDQPIEAACPISM